MTTTTEIPIVPFTARQFTTARAELEAFVRQTNPSLWSDLFEANLGAQVIDLLAATIDTLSYNIDAAASEAFLATARRYESALRFARSVGYVPRSATAAVVVVTPTAVPDAIVESGATIPAGTRLLGTNGAVYELQTAKVLKPGASVSDAQLTLREGTTRQDTFAASRQPGQTVTTAHGVVEDGSWIVYVGAVQGVNVWEQVDNITLAGSTDAAYEVAFDGAGRLQIIFGDGVGGRIPTEAITVAYRTTAGAAGNVAANAIRGVVQAVLGGGGGPVSLSYANSPYLSPDGVTLLGAAAGGDDRESLSDLRTNIPTYLTTQDKAITLSDYSLTAARIPGVSLAYADILEASSAVNAVRLYLWGSEQVEFHSESPAAGVTTGVPYTRYAQLPLNMVATVRAYMAPRTLVSTHTVVMRPTIAWADVYLSDVTCDPSYDPDDLRTDITTAVVGVFEAAGGFEVRMADLYNAVRDVPGVLHFQIDRVVFEQVIKAHARGTLQFSGDTMQDGDTLEVDDGVSLTTFEFDSDGIRTVAGSILVPIGANVEASAHALFTALRANTKIDAYRVYAEVTPTYALEHQFAGAVYNIPMVSSTARLTAEGMTGGSDTIGGGVPSSGSILFTSGEQPADGDTITISDGETTVTFEFDSNATVATGNEPVTIQDTPLATIIRLLDTIEASALLISPTLVAGTTPMLQLVQQHIGVEGNNTITATGIYTVVSGMSGGTGSFRPYREDRRREQNPAVDGWPVGAYEPGAPFEDVGTWLDGGMVPYRRITDLLVGAVIRDRRYYDDTYLYNNEIRYDSGVDLATAVQAVCLRRLVFDVTS